MTLHGLTLTDWPRMCMLALFAEKTPTGRFPAKSRHQVNSMIRKLLFIPVLILLHTVWACGPRDIGTGTSSDTYSQPQGVSVEDRLRYPVYGASNT